MIVIAVIGILLAIAIPEMISLRRRARTNICISNLKNIYGAKAMWALDNPIVMEREPLWDDLVPRYLDARPSCPEGGVYTIGAIREDPACSISYHVLWGSGDETSSSDRPDSSVDDSDTNTGGGGGGGGDVSSDTGP